MHYFLPIVEGHGEVEAVPHLIRRIAHHFDVYDISVLTPIRVKLNGFMKFDKEFNNYISLAANKAKQKNSTIIIILDCDDACPAELGPKILAESRALRRDVEFFVCLALREYETWFLCSIESLRGRCDIDADAVFKEHAESIRNAKGWLSRLMPDGYDPIRHQAALTLNFDLELARNRSRSFNRFYNFIRRAVKQ